LDRGRHCQTKKPCSETSTGVHRGRTWSIFVRNGDKSTSARAVAKSARREGEVSGPAPVTLDRSAIMAIACKRRISSVAVALLLSSLSHDNAIAQTSIFDSPPARDKPAMTPADRAKLQKDLTAARDRQGSNTNAKAPRTPQLVPQSLSGPRRSPTPGLTSGLPRVAGRPLATDHHASMSGGPILMPRL
jgi:hypothetical protein